MAMAASRVPGSLADLASSAAASTTDARWGDGDGDGVIKRRERTRPMTVLCLGLPRTGTTSLRAALISLGISDVYHYNAMLENPADCTVWNEAFALKFGQNAEGLRWGAAEWDRVLGDCMAVTDNPSISFAAELIAAYPSAKVILQTRDSADAFYRSFCATILPVEEAFHTPTSNPLTLFRRWISRPSAPSPFLRLVDNLARWSPTATRRFRVEGREAYERHNEHVRTLMAGREGQLLEYNVKMGWGPLCAFLGVDVPRTADRGGEVDFPRLNDTEEFRRLWEMHEKGYYEGGRQRVVLAVGAVLGVAAVGAAWWLRRGAMKENLS